MAEAIKEAEAAVAAKAGLVESANAAAEAAIGLAILVLGSAGVLAGRLLRATVWEVGP